MAETDNPYESPRTEVQPVPLPGRVLTENMLFYLRAASPWLRFVGIMGFISLGFMAIQFLIMLFAMIFGGMDADVELIPGLEGLGAAVVLVFLLVIGALIFFPAVFTFQCGRKIRAYLHSGDPADLELAFKNNKSLWTYIGVFTILSLAFSGVIMVIAVVAAFAMIAF